MNFAVLFSKYPRNPVISLFSKFYIKFFLRSNTKRIKYLRDAGAKIGHGCTVRSIRIFDSEPFLIEVGDNTYFAGIETRLLTHEGSIYKLCDMGIAPKCCDLLGKIRIGSNCFIGSRCFILKNVTIGDNCIIGAGSVVTRSVPAGSVVAGVPARVICTVEEFYEKNEPLLDDTFGMTPYAKRQYVEANMEKYEMRRREREA